MATLIEHLSQYENADSIGARMRRKRMVHVVGLMETIYKETGACRVLDIGGEGKYWQDTLRPSYMKQMNIHITLCNVEYDPDIKVDMDPALFALHTGDGCNLSYDNNAFDLVHSNSTIEHVGNYDRMIAFGATVRRLAPRYYVQMPYFWFPMEPHFGTLFFHWLPEPVRASMVYRRRTGHYPKADTYARAMEWVQSARLLDTKQFKYIFSDAEIVREKFCGFTKSLIAIRGK